MTVWHSFQANNCSKKSSTRLFWVSGRGQNDVVAVNRVLGKFKFTSCSRGELVARRVINDQVEAMKEADTSGIALEA